MDKAKKIQVYSRVSSMYSLRAHMLYYIEDKPLRPSKWVQGNLITFI